MSDDLTNAAPGSATRLHTSALALGGLLLAGVFYLRSALTLEIGALAALIPVVLVIQHWLGLLGQRVQSIRAAASSVLTFTFVALLSAFAQRDPDEWFPEAPIFLALLITGGTAHAIYARRALAYAADGSVGRLSGDGIRAHFTGYVTGIAAGIGAATLVNTYISGSHRWLWIDAAYGIAFTLGKLGADLLAPRPAPFRQPSLSAALLRMTALSPLWWGLPWGIAYTVFEIVTFGFSGSGGLWHDTTTVVSSVLNVMVAVTGVFSGLTLLTFAQEFFVLRRALPRQDEEALSPGDWGRLAAGVMVLALAAGILMFEPLGPSDDELFGTETWKCARDGNEYKLGWIAREGVHITNLRGGFDFFDMDCVPRTKFHGGCKYDREGWDEVSVVVRGPAASKTIVFHRNDPDVKYGGLYRQSALDLLDALYAGSSAQMTIKAPKGRLLYVLNIDLKGFRPELDKCVAAWNRQPPRTR